MKIPLFLASLTYISVVLANYGDLRRTGSNNRLEFQLSDGTWGTVCSNGFDYDAANTACKQLGYQTDNSYDEEYLSSYYNSPVICDTECYGYESRLSACDLTTCSDDYGCSYIVTLDCYSSSNDNDYDYSSDSSSDSGAAIGGVIGGIFIFGFVFFIVACRIYIRHSYARSHQNRTIIVTQRRTPRILIARVTRTVSSGPPPPPAYTPSAPNAGYTPVQPSGYQPVPTTDYAAANSTNPSAAPDDIPSDPPPAYIPVVPTAPVPVPPNSSQ